MAGRRDGADITVADPEHRPVQPLARERADVAGGVTEPEVFLRFSSPTGFAASAVPSLPEGSDVR